MEYSTGDKLSPLSQEELHLFGSLYMRRLVNLKGNSVVKAQFLKLINKRLWQLTGLIEMGAPDDLIKFQLTQFVAIVSEEAQKLYGKLEYQDLMIEVRNQNYLTWSYQI
jgi:hypothetical protein